MASNNRQRFMEILRLLDCVEIIKENKKLVKPSEKLISNPEELARLIMRRRLKEAFPAFSIRKNQDQYALRCDSEDLYQVLFLASSVSGNSNFSNALHPDYRRKVNTKLEGAFSALQSMRDSRAGISYNFKSDHKLFIYVSFNPLYQTSQALTACERFDDMSLKSRINRMDAIGKAVSKIELDSGLEDLLYIIQRETIYNIYNARLELTEDFVTFYANSLRSEQYIPIKIAMRVFKRRQMDELSKQAILKGQQEEISKILKTIEGTEQPQIVPGIRLVDRSTSMAVPDIDVDVRRNPFENVLEEVETEAVEDVAISPASDDAQNAFERALRALRGNNTQSQAEQAVTMVDNAILRPIKPEELAEAQKIKDDNKEYHDEFNNTIYGPDFLIYSHHVNIDERPSNMKYTDIDIYDDLDKEKDGLYFTVKNGVISHQIIVKNEVVFETVEKDLAESKFKDIFGTEPKELKFYME